MKINVNDLCPKCQVDHKDLERVHDKQLPVTKSELCLDCKNKLGLGRAKGAPEMKRKRKYTRRAGTTAGKTPKLDKDTKRFIKNLLKSGKKAEKLEARAEKLQARAGELFSKAAVLKAGIEALKSAVQACE